MTSREGDFKQTVSPNAKEMRQKPVRDVVKLQGASPQLAYLNGRCKIVSVIYIYKRMTIIAQQSASRLFCPSVSEEQLKRGETFMQ